VISSESTLPVLSLQWKEAAEPAFRRIFRVSSPAVPQRIRYFEEKSRRRMRLTSLRLAYAIDFSVS
jgi:hypothetical protein